MAKRTKKKKWFIPVRSSYLPNSWQAWLLYIPFTAYLVFSMVVGWNQMDTASQAILFIVPNWVAATAIMTWIARRTS
ncbi:MAG TPA: hypothetical protein VLF88_01570 [Candidatus Babeliales bacterium]|nr:hypothetical protein [Candidatus Babeliales bacterium]